MKSNITISNQIDYLKITHKHENFNLSLKNNKHNRNNQQCHLIIVKDPRVKFLCSTFNFFFLLFSTFSATSGKEMRNKIFRNLSRSSNSDAYIVITLQTICVCV